ncbi:MAG: SBBP repeat-containing protein [Planctomycetota bacterium]
MSVQYEAFILKLAGNDGTLLYSTYFGTERNEMGYDIAVNAAGEMYVVGETDSLYFPLVNPVQGQLGDPYHEDAFIIKLSADGGTLLYSTYFGGNHADVGRGIELDAAGRIYIVGHANSTDFPLVNPVQPVKGGGQDAFAARLTADGSTIEYSTYLGGEEGELVYGLALDAQDRLHISGSTESIYYPTTPGAYQESFVGEILGCDVPFGRRYNCPDVFVTRLAPDGATLAFSTFLGGHQTDSGYGLAVGPAGRVYASGHTKSDDFPPYNSGTFYTNFLTRLDDGGGTLAYSWLNQVTAPVPAFVAVDAAGDIYVVGHAPDLTVWKLHDAGSLLIGDLNCDGIVNFDDINPFVLALSDPVGYAAAFPNCNINNGDVNGDGAVDFDDINPFVALLAGS